jgi:TonB family protein
MAVLPFIAKLIMSCGLLYGYYHLFLRNKRFHHYNRFYLLAVALFSLIIPFINIPVNLFWGNQQHSTLIKTLKVINANGWEEPVTIYARQNQWSRWLNMQNGLYFIYIAGALTGFIILFRSVAWIKHLKRKYPYEIIDQLKIYSTTEPGTPFSFFKSIFWDNKISLEDNRGQQIFRHEMFHVKEKHSTDVLLMEILCCIGWFNPFFHLIKKEIKAIHEFLADEYAISANNRYEYAELLVSHAITQKTLTVANPFFHNQIKRRITMITQSNLIRRSGYISRIMALPLLFLLVSAFAVKLTGKSSGNSITRYASRKMTVVIDAGHGGKFAGANNGEKLNEKDITLSIAQKIKELSAGYNVNIILTRNSDQLVGNAANLREDLDNRIEIANNAKSDLFVSIHVNAFIKENASLSGFDAYVSGKKETEKARQLASAILTSLKNVYAINEVIQQREVGVQVLDKTNCPSVIIECGYITNAKDVAFITDAANQEKVARKILEGIVQYQQSNSKDFTFNTASQLNQNRMLTSAELEKLLVEKKVNRFEAIIKNDIVVLKYGKDNGDSIFISKQEFESYSGKLKSDPVNSGNKIFKRVVTSPEIVDNNSYENTINENLFASRSDRLLVQDTFTKVETEAQYPGGTTAWRAYLFKTLKYPQEAQDKEVKGTVIVQFIVDEQGKISNVKAISGPALLRAESIRMIKESGTWIAAMNNGKKVKAYKRQPITYQLEVQN